MDFHSVFLLLGIITIVATLVSLRREHIRTEYSVSWLVLGSILSLSALFPGTLDEIAKEAGFDPRVFFVLVSGGLSSILLFDISHVVSKLRDENVMLAQKLATLEYQLERALENSDARRT